MWPSVRLQLSSSSMPFRNSKSTKAVLSNHSMSPITIQLRHHYQNKKETSPGNTHMRPRNRINSRRQTSSWQIPGEHCSSLWQLTSLLVSSVPRFSGGGIGPKEVHSLGMLQNVGTSSISGRFRREAGKMHCPASQNS